MKTLWRKNDHTISGRPVWEWTHYVLTELRLKQGASLDYIRDYLNDNGVPSPRKRFWAPSSIHSLLQPSALLQYTSFGVWNVHGKKGKILPPSEWVLVENAHPAIITMDEAEAIMKVNEQQRRASNNKSGERMSSVRSKDSRYVLSGGLFVCSRCGANMVGHTNRKRLYYRCGSCAYRKGLGCGSAFQVPKEDIESAAFEESGHFFNSLADGKRMKDLMEKELKNQENNESSKSSVLTMKLENTDRELENVRSSIRNGLKDVDWANDEIGRLKVLKRELQAVLEED